MNGLPVFTPHTYIIDSKDDLFEIVKSVREYRLKCMIYAGLLICEMYRGQGREGWTLTPNIARTLKDSNQAKEIEKMMVQDFNDELAACGLSKSLQGKFLNQEYHSDWLLLQQSQHYGIPTRFMDWTINWEIALFFAVCNPKDDGYDGQFWIYTVHPDKLYIDNSSSTYLTVDPFEFNQSIFLNSSGFLSDGYLDKIAERRKTRQNGRFCIQPYDRIFTPLEEQAEHKPNLTKITIPKALKKSIREELAADYFTAETLYVNEDSKIDAIVKMLRSKYGV